ncbi:MAG: hypothetical protein JOZ51_09360, partial [Chloroflexi bacterium]|nr:hypothetical protein [Chloroflexota bacterium]
QRTKNQEQGNKGTKEQSGTENSPSPAAAGEGSRASDGVRALAQPPTRIGLYEPIHGSAPDIAGQGVANPLATILSVGLLLRYSLGLHNEAQAVDAAVQQVLVAGQVTPDIAPAGLKPLSTSQVGDAVVAALRSGS